jgi:hypothetical protein
MEELVKKAEDMGINVEDVLISLISKNDPRESIPSVNNSINLCISL